MSGITVGDIIAVLEEVAPSRLQEDFDNTGIQVGDPAWPCTGVLLCVDVTPEIVAEAVSRRCNMIVSHHPLLFHGLKRITGAGRVEKAVIAAIKADVAVYSCHTSIDNAPGGVSWRMAHRLGLSDCRVLESKTDSGLGAVGCGVVGEYVSPVSLTELVDHKVRVGLSSPVARCSDPSVAPAQAIARVALCGGAGSFLIEDAIAAGAQAFITSDCKYNLFLDYADRIFLVDIGHFESEECTKEIFYHIITKKFPNFALYYSELEKNPIIYL